MSEFSDRPFVAGSLIGLRAFAVDHLGRLKGPAFGGIFKPGENEARCGGDTSLGAMTAQLNAAMSRLTSSRMWSVPTTFEVSSPLSVTGKAAIAAEPHKRPPHVVGGVNCACGYYAYFNGDNSYAKKDRVSAVIEGYGVCTVGEKGFRASKARLVALVLPKRPRFLTTWKVSALFVAVFTVLTTMRALQGDWLVAAFDAAFALGWSISLGLRIRTRLKTRSLSKIAALVRRAYPDVPTYPTVRKALRKHPLTPPEPDPLPTPDTEDFWTREVPR